MTFETMGFRTFANNDVQIKQTVFKNFEEVTHFCSNIDPRPAFKFFVEELKKWPYLQNVLQQL